MLYSLHDTKFQSYLNLELCPICMEPLGFGDKACESVRTACGHRFHLACLDPHRKSVRGSSESSGCPVCRTWIGQKMERPPPANDISLPHPLDTRESVEEMVAEMVVGMVAEMVAQMVAQMVAETLVETTGEMEEETTEVGVLVVAAKKVEK